LKKFKEFPNKFIFDESELTQEIDERDNIEFEFEKKRSMSICAIQQELSKINNITVLNDNKIQKLLEWFDLVEDYEDNPESVNIQELEKQVIEQKNKLLKQITELETMTITEEEIGVKARDIINNKLDKFIDNYILEYTPLGNIYMRYNNDKKSFEYFSNNSIPYRYLEPVGRKYVMTYWCKPIFVDIEEELKKAEEIYDKKVVDLNNKELNKDLKRFNPKNVLVKLKDYNKDTKENSIRPMKNRTDNNSILPAQIKNNLPDINKKSEKMFLKEKANRYTWEGRLTNFCPLKKIDKKMIDKNLNMTYTEFKKLQQELQNKK
jgi:hypothetical protein